MNAEVSIMVGPRLFVCGVNISGVPTIANALQKGDGSHGRDQTAADSESY